MLERSPSAMAEMIKGRVREFVREPSSFFFVLLMPLLWMTILGYALNTPRQDIYGVGWVLPDQSVGASAEAARQATQVHAALAAAPQVKLHDGDQETLTTRLKRGEVQIILTPPAVSGQAWGYSYDPVSKEAQHARAAVAALVEAALGRHDLAPTHDQAVTVPGTRYVDFLVPALIALSVMTTSLFGTGAVIVTNRRENLLKRYLATPMRASHYILSHLFGRMIMLAVEMAAILLGAWLIFGFKSSGSLAALAVVALLGAGAFTALTMLCASRTSNMGVLNGMTNLISMPMMLLGGVWFSRTNFPDWLNTIARFLPLTALVDSLRKIALEGATLASVGFEMVVMTVYLIACGLGARAFFKWY